MSDCVLHLVGAVMKFPDILAAIDMLLSHFSISSVSSCNCVVLVLWLLI